MSNDRPATPCSTEAMEEWLEILRDRQNLTIIKADSVHQSVNNKEYLISAFYFHRAPEGSDFWWSIYEGVGHTEESLKTVKFVAMALKALSY